ncbi:MAG: hypothetical protein GC206_13215 [Alphaproteobacteria bacterium]|nr:hypothetical protein [Alphaproteobacteria bacterium]
MEVKLIEIRDRATFIAAWAFKTESHERTQQYLLRRCGWEPDGVIMGRLDSGSGQAGPYDWNDRTMTTAHVWLCKHFDEVENGAVVDVEFILGETREPKRSERETTPAL